MTPGSHPAVARYSLEELEAIVDEAGEVWVAGYHACYWDGGD
jgi:hypothetical protein